jgi:hypothetical protein
VEASYTAPEHATIDEIVHAVRASLTDDLLDPKWRRIRSKLDFVTPETGHCFVAAQTVYWLLGGSDAGWKGCVMTPDPARPKDTHWFVRNIHTGEIIDPTSSQFRQKLDYATGRGCGFSTRAGDKPKPGPCKRTLVALDRVQALLAKPAHAAA